MLTNENNLWNKNFERFNVKEQNTIKNKSMKIKSNPA